MEINRAWTLISNKPLALFAILWNCAYCAPLLAADYKVFRTLNLGSGYQVEILRDKAVDQADKNSGDDPLVLYLQDTGGSYANAKLQVVGPDGKTIFSQVFERPLADFVTFEPKPNPSEGKLFWVMVDYSAEAGSYNGPGYFLGQFKDGNFHWVQSQACDGKQIQVTVASTLKTGWRVNTHGDILEVACRPYDAVSKTISDPIQFFVYHTRWHWDGQTWRFFESWKKGFWEEEGSNINGPTDVGQDTDFPNSCKKGERAYPYWGE